MSNEHDIKDNSEQDMSCNLTSSSSSNDGLYHALGDAMVDFCLRTCTSQVDIFNPLTRNQTMKGPQAAEWLAAK